MEYYNNRQYLLIDICLWIAYISLIGLDIDKILHYKNVENIYMIEMSQNHESIKQHFSLQKLSFLFYIINLLNESEIYYFSIMDTVFASYSENLQCPLSKKSKTLKKKVPTFQICSFYANFFQRLGKFDNVAFKDTH